MAAVDDGVAPLPGRRTGAGGGAGRYRVCVVCMGNICRSPTAEVVLRDELDRAGLGDRVSVESAGTGDWHLGWPMHPPARAELARHGYDGGEHRARQITADWLADFDLLVAMDRRNLTALRAMAAGDAELANGRIRLMRSFDPAAGPDVEVPDPYEGSQADFRQAFEMVRAAARGLTARLGELLAGGPAEG
jgi:protein-tyrosine phosphatase